MYMYMMCMYTCVNTDNAESLWMFGREVLHLPGGRTLRLLRLGGDSRSSPVSMPAASGGLRFHSGVSPSPKSDV